MVQSKKNEPPFQSKWKNKTGVDETPLDRIDRRHGFLTETLVHIINTNASQFDIYFVYERFHRLPGSYTMDPYSPQLQNKAGAFAKNKNYLEGLGVVEGEMKILVSLK